MKQLFFFFGTVLLMLTLGFMMGKSYQIDKDRALITTLQSRDVSQYIIDGDEKYLDSGLIYVPNEISQVSWYDDKNIDLMFCIKDDAGDYHFGFTGKTIPRDSLHLDEMDTRNHSELKPIDTQVAIPARYKPRHKVKRYPGFDDDTHFN